MSSRVAKWLFVLFLVIVALYAAYPPVRVPVETKKIVEKPGGEKPETTVVDSTYLPLALGERSQETTVMEVKDDGTVVKKQTTYVEGRIKLGLDIAGGTELVYQLKPRKGQEKSGELGDTISVLRQRIDPQNVKEFRIQEVGENRILIQVPRATQAEVKRLKNRLTRMGRLEFKLALPRGNSKYASKYKKAKQGIKVDGYDKMYVEGNPERRFFLVKEGKPEITGRLLSSVNITTDQTGAPAVGFEFNSQGRAQFASITERNQGWSLAIVLDGELKSAPRIRSRIAGRGIIEGDFTMKEVRDMVTILRAGSLPVDLKLLQETTVGPKLGQDAIQRGLRAVAVGGLLVLLFIGGYYLSCGLVADGALILNLVLLTGVLGLLGAALTLPGIAGILLTVGMAVDANVLIFERIREESGAGKTVHVALRNGYERAYSTIIDANVTTLLTAVILYLVGTGPVRGFAITLSAGIILSMFTALYVTRLALETSISRGWLDEFSMFSIVGDTDISFSNGRRVAYAVSGIVLVVGLVSFFGRGSALYGVDFTGGSLVYLSFDDPVPTQKVRSRIAKAGYSDAQVQSIQGDKATDRTASRNFRVRIKGVGRKRLQDNLKPELLKKLNAADLSVKKQALTVGADGASLTLTLPEKVTELNLRRAIAGEKGDVYDIGDIRKIESTEDGESDRYTIRLAELPALPDMKQIWSDLLRVAAFARVSRRECALQLGNIEPAGGDDESFQIEAKTGRKIQWQSLGIELDRRQFGELTVERKDEPAQSFALVGSKTLLERLKDEMPETVNLPDVTFEGPGITAKLQEKYTEADIRAFADQEGMEDLYVVPRGVRSAEYILQVSQAPIKTRLNELFSDLGGRSVTIDQFSVAKDASTEGEKVRVKMRMSPALTMPAIKYYLEKAGFGARINDLLVTETENPATELSTVVLRMPQSQVQQAKKLIMGAFEEAHPVRQIMSIGAVVAREMKGRALLAVLCAAVVIVFYMAFRFHAVKYGIAAVIAVMHDVCITAGIIALADWSGAVGDIKITLSMLAAFLTILGYSLNDTIVVFDRIRENTIEAGKNAITGELVDKSLNQVLSRTILTSLTTLIAVTALYVFGGAELQGLAFTLIIGILVGTYSSIYIASPILLDWD